jgi:hypothetical protein
VAKEIVVVARLQLTESRLEQAISIREYLEACLRGLVGIGNGVSENADRQPL